MTAYVTDVARSLAPKTVERHTFGLKLFGRFLTETGRSSLRVADLTRALLVEFHAWLSAPNAGRHKRDRKPGTARKVVEVVQIWWKWLADESDWADMVPRPRTIKMKRDPAGPTIAPTWDEMDRCIANAFGWRKKLTTVMRFTGLRPFQVMLATWDDIDLERGLFVVRHGKSSQEKQGRIVPISPHLVREIEKWDGTRAGWLIDTGLKTPRVRQSREPEMKECWERAKVRKQVWARDPHRAFRKGFQSGLKDLGADDEAVKYLVGHDLGVRARYIDPSNLKLKQAVALIPPLAEPKVVSIRGVA